MPGRPADDALASQRGEEQEVPDPDIPAPLLPGHLRADQHPEASERDGAERRGRPAELPLRRAGQALLRVHHHRPRHPRALSGQSAQGHDQVRRGHERQAPAARDLPVHRSVLW